MSKLKWVLIVLLIILVGTIVFFVVKKPLVKGESQKTDAKHYYWVITTNRTSLKGSLPDLLEIFTPDQKLIFSSDTVKPLFEEKPKIKTATEKTESGEVFSQTFNYDFAEVVFKVNLFDNQKYADLQTETTYLKDKANQYEGLELAFDGFQKTSYFDETFTKKELGAQAVQISQWSPHVLEIGTQTKATLADHSAEVMEIKKLKNTAVKFFSYYGPTRENVFARNYEGAKNADPKIDTNIKRKEGEKVALDQRLFLSQDSLNYLPFRWPYAKDSVVSLVSHADLGSIKDVENEGVDRINSVFYGSSRTDNPDYGKKGILSHNLRTTFTVFSVKDSEENSNNGSTLEAPKFLNAVKELYRRGVDIGAHRLAYEGIGEYKKDTEKITEGLNIISQFNPTIWIDHRIRDCNTDPRQENIAACGSLNGDKLNVTEQLSQGSWKYWWASGQDSQGGGKDYQLSAFEDFLSASRVLYYYQGATNAIIPPQLWAFAQSYTYEKKEFSEADLEKLAKDKGFHNVHAYFVANSSELDSSSLKKDSDGNTYWRTSTHLENGLKLLEEFQEEDLVWVRDFTTVADYLRQWQKIKILDFTNDTVTIQNQGEAIDGLTIISPSGTIGSAKAGEKYLTMTRDQYAVLPRINKGEITTVSVGDGANSPRIKNISDKHIAISDASYNPKSKEMILTFGPSGKVGQDLVVKETEIIIELPSAAQPKVYRDDQKYSDYSVNGNLVTLKTDTNNHVIKILLTGD